MALGFALVGCGRIAQRYLSLLSRGEIRHARLVAVSDIRPERAEKAGRDAEVPAFTDMHTMIAAKQNDIDVVCILTESGMHAAHTLALAPYRKHIIIEKPMALRLEDADEMIRSCDTAGIKLFVVKQNRLNLPVVKLREALEAGRFGRITMGTVRVRWCRTQSYYNQDAWRGTWALDGGVFANQASHHIDLLEWMLGTPLRVFAKIRTALVDIECEDTGVGLIEFDGGALGIIEATTATRPKDLEGSLSILGEKGTAEIGGFAVNKLKSWLFEDCQPSDDAMLETCCENPPDIYGFGHRKYLAHVVDAILEGRPSLVDGLEGRKSLELISALYESAETGQEVVMRFRPCHGRLGEASRLI